MSNPQLPSGYEPIDGKLYPTKELQRAAYEDIRVYTSPNDRGSFLYGKKKANKALDLAWPLDKVFITQKFGERPAYYKKYNLPGHNGVDFRVRFIDSPLGRRHITAVSDGSIDVARADAGGYGTHIRQTLLDGSLVIYGHLTRSYVSKGQKVKKGDVIGLSGNTGDSNAPHLHLELRLSGWEKKGAKDYHGAVDPLPFLPPIK